MCSHLALEGVMLSVEEKREVVVYSVAFLYITHVLLLLMALGMWETAAAKTGEINLSALSHNHFIFRKRKPKQKFPSLSACQLAHFLYPFFDSIFLYKNIFIWLLCSSFIAVYLAFRKCLGKVLWELLWKISRYLKDVNCEDVFLYPRVEI